MGARRPSLWISLALLFAVVALYWPVREHDWVRYDDDAYLLENPHVQKGLDWGEVRWAFTHNYVANYHPLTWVAHMLDVQLFGLEPGPHHLVNVGLHALNAVLAFWFLRALLGRTAAAGFGAALFALHPLRVESVAWASERKDVLCATFFLAALLLYLWYARAPAPGRYLLLCLALALALLAKPMAVTLPAVLLLLDCWPLGRLERGERGRVLLEKLPLFALAALGALSTWFAQAKAGSIGSFGTLGLDLRAMNALRTLGVYLAQTFWPRGLSVFYPHAAVLTDEPRRALLLPALAGALVLLASCACAYRLRRKLPLLAGGSGFYLVTLLPVIGLVQVGTQAHADRYTYLPSLGILVVLLAALAPLERRFARPLAAVGAVLVLACAVLTRAQLAHWRDTETLFTHALALDARNHFAHMKIGEAHLAAGDVGAARAAFERSLAVQPRFVEALNDLALCNMAEGELERARTLLERALRIEPGDFGAALSLGSVELERGDLEAAREHLEACFERRPTDRDVLFNLGLLARREGDGAEAERLFRQVLAQQEGHLESLSSLGQVLLAQGRTAEALEAFARVVALDPQDPIGHFNLGIVRRKAGNRDGAREAFARALGLDADLEPAQAALRELDEER